MVEKLEKKEKKVMRRLAKKAKKGLGETEMETISDFVALAVRLKNEWFPREVTWGPWFRGHTEVDWKLAPKLYRDSAPKRGIRVIEDEIRQEFMMRAPGLTDSGPQNSWEWYFIMQHSGAPTRLLDWTEGALIALYFAVRDSKEEKDAVVWALDPWWLNKCVLGEREVVAPGAEIGISKSDADRYSPWLPARYLTAELPELPVAVYPTHTARRISTQRSCFTIHGSDIDGLEQLRQEPGAHMAKIVVPRAAVLGIREELLISGIDEVTIFPDLDGLGRFLTTVLKSETNGE
jgi:hypothetical protein